MTITNIGASGTGSSGLSYVQQKQQTGSANLSLVTSQPKPEIDQELTKEQVRDAVKKLNQVVSPVMPSLEFSMDDSTGKVIVKVVDVETKAVIRQIPNKEAVAFSKTIDQLENLQGLIFSKKV